MALVQRGGLQIEVSEAGAGAPVLLAHSSASSNRQWNKLTTVLAGRYRVLAPNLRGYGATTAWPGGRQTLADAAAPLLALCEAFDTPVRLVGHSFGGALALWAARTLGPRVSHLVLYEPMLPGLLQAHGRAQAAAEAAALHADVRRHAAAGDWQALGQRFTDYFNGDGAWAASAPERRQAIAAALPPNVHEWDTAMARLRAEAFAGVSARCLLLCGTRTRRVLHEIADVLARQHPHWKLEELPDAGHMAPLTQADLFNRRVAEWLAGPAAGGAA